VGIIYIQIDSAGNKAFHNLLYLLDPGATDDRYVTPDIFVDPSSDLPVVIFERDFQITPYYYNTITIVRLDSNGEITEDQQLYWVKNVGYTIYRSSFPAIAADNAGRIHGLWLYDDSGSYHVGYSNSDADTWWTLSNEAAEFCWPVIELGVSQSDGQDRINVAWNRTNEITWTQIDQSGVTVVDDFTVVSGAAGQPQSLSLDMASFEQVYFAWADQRDGNAEIYRKACTPGSTETEWTCGGDERLTDNPGSSIKPSIAVPLELCMDQPEQCQSLANTVWQDDSYDGNYELFFAGWTFRQSISGQVVDAHDMPVPGVTISAGAAGSAATAPDGGYTISGVISGTYVLRPSLSGYTFSPPTRTVTLPPDATGQDFTAWQKPVVLVLGFQGFGRETWRCSDGVELLAPGVGHTFGAMAQWLEDLEYDIWIAHLDTGPLRTPSFEVNAQCLKGQIDQVRQLTGQDVILVAHSMGGLVSRACLSLGDCRDHVDALFTLGSAHAGIHTLFLLKLLALLNPRIPGELVCAWQPALCQFSSGGIGAFNRSNPNRPGVDYRFIGGTKTPFHWGLGWLLLALEGPHDGLVGGHSAVGWVWPTGLNAVRGPDAGRYWTNETHTNGMEYPSYFQAFGGPESQAFRCIAWQLGKRSWVDCAAAGTLALTVTEQESSLSAVTIDVGGHITSGQTVSHSLQIDTSEHALFHLSWLSGTLAFTLTQPNGQVITPLYAETHPEVVTYTVSAGADFMPPSASYAFTTTVPGLYTMTISADEVGVDGTNTVAFAALETDRIFSVAPNAGLHQVGDTATFTGTLQTPGGGIAGADVRVRLTRMDGLTEMLALADLGDGTYRALYTIPDAPGYLQATFTAIGDDDGTAFTRQVDKLLLIGSQAAQLTGSYADRAEDRDGDGFDDTLALDAGVTATEVGTYTIAADLAVGKQTIAHATQYEVLASGTQTVTLYFDGWEIRRSGLDGPYTVRHVYLTDLGAGGVPAQIADDVWTTGPYRWRDFGFERFYLPLALKNH
jgi:pimeloyl-ACP methyl ester carboxylesterase